MVPNRHRVTFKASKMIKEPEHISFVKKDGKHVDFSAHKKVKEKVEVHFLARNQNK